MQTRQGALLAVLSALLLVAGRAAPAKDEESAEKEMEFYPIAWAKIDYKPIVDNNRLFKKYKECVLSETPVMGCPRDVTALKKVLPEAMDNTCAKCLPEHIKMIKEFSEYFCEKRRDVYDEAMQLRDPNGELRAKFYAKYGKINC